MRNQLVYCITSYLLFVFCTAIPVPHDTELSNSAPDIPVGGPETGAYPSPDEVASAGDATNTGAVSNPVAAPSPVVVSNPAPASNPGQVPKPPTAPVAHHGTVSRPAAAPNNTDGHFFENVGDKVDENISEVINGISRFFGSLFPSRVR